MAIARLVPSSYSWVAFPLKQGTIENPNNMLNNTDNTTYSRVRMVENDTNREQLIFTGFDLSSIPSNAIINSFTIKYKIANNGITEQTGAYIPFFLARTGKLTYGELQKTSLPSINTITPTFNFDDIDSSSSFNVFIYSSTPNTAYLDIYGVEIYVDYMLPIYRTITSTLTGNGSITPSGSITLYEGQKYNLTINPISDDDEVTATKNNIDITSSLVEHIPSPSSQKLPETYTLVSGGFNGQAATYFSGLVGKGYDNSTTTSNYYSSNSNTIAVFTYDMKVTDIPDNATITNCYLMVNGHAESTSNSNEYMCVSLISGSDILIEELNFKSIGTSNTTQTLTATVMPTIEQLANAKMQCRLGYYGGAINGATLFVEYLLPGGLVHYYTYSYTVEGDATINVKIGSTPIPGINNARIGTNTPSNFYVGSSGVSKMYVGSSLIYEVQQ